MIAIPGVRLWSSDKVTALELSNELKSSYSPAEIFWCPKPSGNWSSMMASIFFEQRTLASVQLGIRDIMKHASAMRGQDRPLRWFEPMPRSAFEELIPLEAATSVLDTL